MTDDSNSLFFFFFQAEDGIRDVAVTGVQTCALPIWLKLAMLDLLARQEPQVKHILTGNAETNAHMIGINEMLGYRVVGPPEGSWDLPAARVTGTAQS